METYCSNSDSPATSGLNRLVGYHRVGLSLPDVIVMGCFVEVACLDTDLAAVKLSAFEVAKRSGLSLSAVKRAIAKLLAADLLVRRQDVRMAGVMAWTQVSRAACTLFGVEGGAHLAAGMSVEMKLALAGESVPVCAGVSQAWVACEPMPAEVESAWRSGAGRLTLVRSSLATRAAHAIEQTHLAQAGREAEQIAAASGFVHIACPGGGEVHVDVKRLDAVAPCPADVGFARDVLLELAVRQPDLVTPTSVPRLLAEVLYSRAVGFVAGREYTPAVRVLVSCMASTDKPWGRPHGIWDVWYAAVQGACRFSTAGSVLRH